MPSKSSKIKKQNSNQNDDKNAKGNTLQSSGSKKKSKVDYNSFDDAQFVNEIPKITLFKNPIKTLLIFSLICLRALKYTLKFIFKHVLLCLVVIAIIALPHLIVEGPHKKYVEEFDEAAYFALYWIVLGIASSVGFGTGLHTFVLYLGPYIAKVTMVANECNTIPEYLPSRWNLERFAECPEDVKDHISFWTILATVQLEAFLWGLGTAIGELPPYFVARAASIAGNTSEELEELEKGSNHGLVDRIKVLIYRNLKKYGFITILLCASIPNPLFDLAGITCGHFGIPFLTFFGATFIGKAIIKVHLQMIFVIFTFTAHHVETVLNFVESNFPIFKHSLTKMLEAQKKQLHSPKISNERHIIAVIWDYVILAMIIFFVISIINSLVAGYIEEEQKKKRMDEKKK